MKSLIISALILVTSVNHLLTEVKEGFDKYTLDAVCIQEHVAKGYERKAITDKQCPNNSLVKKVK